MIPVCPIPPTAEQSFTFPPSSIRHPFSSHNRSDIEHQGFPGQSVLLQLKQKKTSASGQTNILPKLAGTRTPLCILPKTGNYHLNPKLYFCLCPLSLRNSSASNQCSWSQVGIGRCISINVMFLRFWENGSKFLYFWHLPIENLYTYLPCFKTLY